MCEQKGHAHATECCVQSHTGGTLGHNLADLVLRESDQTQKDGRDMISLVQRTWNGQTPAEGRQDRGCRQ